MANPFQVKQSSALEDVLAYLNRPGAAVRNLITGNVEGAVRQGADLVADTIDAVLPGDWIKPISRAEDSPEFSDVIGGMEPGIGKTAVDILGGIATDPLTYTGIGLFTKPLSAAASAAKNVATKLPGGAAAVGKLEQGIEAGGKALRSVSANQRVEPELAAAIQTGRAAGSAAGTTAQRFAVDAFKDVPPEVQDTVKYLFEDIGHTGGQLSPLGVSSPAKFGNKAEQMALIDARLSKLNLDPVKAQQVRSVAERVSDFTSGLWKQGAESADAPIFGNRTLDAAGNAAARAPDQFPLDYIPRQWEEVAAKEAPIGGLGSAIKARSVGQGQELLDYMKSSGKELTGGLPDLLGNYGQNIGRLTQSAAIGRGVQGLAQAGKLAVSPETLAKIKTGTALADDEFRGAMGGIIDDLKSAGKTEDAEVLEAAFRGLPPRGDFMKALSGVNGIFKKFATSGAFIPRINFSVRNAVGAAAQTAANQEARGQTGLVAASIVGNTLKSMGDGLRKLGVKWVPESEFKPIDDAILTSGGRVDDAISRISDPSLREAFAHGILDNTFVRTEDLIADTARTGWWKKFQDIRDWPQAIAQGMEQRLRFTLFKGLRQSGKSPEEASRIVTEAMYDYTPTSVSNRTARDFLPFFQFSAKAVPQSFNALKENPWLIPAVRPLFGGDDESPMPAYLSKQMSIPTGTDEEGNPTYLTSLGLPLESLGMIPNPSDDLSEFARQLRQNVIGSSSPILKTAYGAVTGVDPTFGSTFASYNKTPEIAQEFGAPETSEAGRIYNAIAGTGLIQPIASPVNTISGLFDDRQGALMTGLNTLTGLRNTSVDEDATLRRLLADYLRSNPNVQQFTSFYQGSPDEENQALLNQLKEIQARMKLKRMASP